MKIKLGIIFGGKNIKNDESIDKTIDLVEYIDKNKYDVVPIYISEDKTWYTGKMLLEKDIYNYFNDLKKYAKRICITKKTGQFKLQTTGNIKRDINYLDIVLPMIDNNDIFGFLDTLGIPYIGTKTVDNIKILKKILQVDNINMTDSDGEKYDCVLLDDESSKVVGIVSKDLDLNNIQKLDLSEDIQDKMKEITEKIYDLFMIKGFLKVRFTVSPKEVYVDSISTNVDINALYALDQRHKNYTNLIDDIISITVETYKEKEETKIPK